MTDLHFISSDEEKGVEWMEPFSKDDLFGRMSQITCEFFSFWTDHMWVVFVLPHYLHGYEFEFREKTRLQGILLWTVYYWSFGCGRIKSVSVISVTENNGLSKKRHDSILIGTCVSDRNLRHILYKVKELADVKCLHVVNMYIRLTRY